jgi:hypothetical protein
MIGHASLPSPLVKRPNTVREQHRQGLEAWQRRTLEALVAILAFGVWGTLAYKGLFRLIARAEGMILTGHVLIDGLSLVIGISGSIAGISALWAIGMRAFGRTPMSLVGAPDDSPADTAYRASEYAARSRRGGSAG